jgi:hypothetical protein
VKRFLYSVLFRKSEKEEAKNREKIVKEQLKKNEKRRRHKKILFGDGSKFIKKARANLNFYMPMLVMFLLRFFLAFQAYMYSRSLGLLHLFWILWSFVFPYKNT